MSFPVDISDAARRIRDGVLTPTALVERCLERIDRYESLVKAWVRVDRDAALDQAKACEERLARGDDPGPLAGIPIGIKDIVDVQDCPTLAGSPLRGECPDRYIAGEDAPIVRRLREAGAIVLGKTVTVQFACFDPSETRNPWDPSLESGEPTYTAGGSSSGSAAAAAMGMCLAAIGTQTGGSLVRPASYCGVAAMKPTLGRVDGAGIVPVTDVFDTPGPMARTVGDLAALFACFPRGRGLAPVAAGEGADTGPASFGPLDRPPRIGLVRSYFMEECVPAVRSAVEQAVERLRSAGATVEEVELSLQVPINVLLEIHTTVMAADAAAYHRDDFPRRRDAYGPMIGSLLEHGLELTAVEFSRAMARLRTARREAVDLVGEFDALLAPATDTTAPASRDTTGPKSFQAPWSCWGLPIVSVPCATAEDGLPVAVQLAGRYGEDWRLLATARWCEAAFDFQNRPPLWQDGE